MEIIKLNESETRKATIRKVEPVEFWNPRKNRIVRRLTLTMEDERGLIFQANQILDSDMKIRSLEIYGNKVHPAETLGKLLVHLKIDSTDKLIGKQIYLGCSINNKYLLPIVFDPKDFPKKISQRKRKIGTLSVTKKTSQKTALAAIRVTNGY